MKASSTLPKDLLQRLVDEYLDPLLVLDKDDIVVLANLAAKRLLGNEYLEGEACPVDLSAGTLTLPDEDEVPQDFLVRCSRLDDNLKVVLFSPAAGGWAEETERLAFEDALTGLPNLNIIRQFMDFTITQAKRYQRAAALLVLDLDRFKVINDALGPVDGDALLCEVAGRLQGNIRSSDIIGRRGEDEFLILLTELSDDRSAPGSAPISVTERAAAAANRLMESFAEPFVLGEQEFFLTSSVGISLCPDDSDSVESMLEHADTAVALAKELGRNRFQFFTPDVRERHDHRIQLESALRSAVENRAFRLLYHPVVALESGLIVGAEALLRWQRDDRLVPAAEFISVAEESGLIVPIGRQVLQEALDQAVAWRDAGLNLTLNLNLSARQLLAADLSGVLLAALKERDLDPELLQVDIQESAADSHPERARDFLDAVHAGGVRIALDDFGSGLTSLQQIRSSRAQVLKIDPDLVAQLPAERETTEVVRAIISLAKTLGLICLAEGLETEEQWHICRELGCNLGQGFVFSEPIEADEVTKLVASGTPYV